MKRVQKTLQAMVGILCGPGAVAGAFVGIAPARAEIIAAPALFYRTEHVLDNTGSLSNVEDRFLSLDLRAAYLFHDLGFLAGALYRYETDGTINSDLRGSAYGPSLGYTKSGWTAWVTYVLAGERRNNVGGAEKKLLKAHGFQIDLAWTPVFWPELLPNLGFGPQLTYQNLRYDRSKIGNSDETGDGYEDVTLTPGFALLWAF